eukprot:6900728-Prymnesium_polylepis.1
MNRYTSITATVRTAPPCFCAALPAASCASVTAVRASQRWPPRTRSSSSTSECKRSSGRCSRSARAKR